MNEACGKKVWIFPDADMPPVGNHPLKGHESLIILNTNSADADIQITLYFEDREPIGPLAVTVRANRVRCLRMDNPKDIVGFTVPRETQYAIKVESSLPVVAQYGRLDTREQPMAFYTNTGYAY